MPDREKVLKGLEYCKEYFSCCSKCPYWQDKLLCTSHLVRDVLELLKEQEPKTGKWILDDEDANSWECSECGGLLLINDGTPLENDWYFCPYCGSKLEEQAVKWK